MGDKKEKRVTLQDVAKDAGVSRATASLVVRGSTSITEQTKQKVLASMNKLGYVYDRVAASFRSRRSSTVGIIITDIGNPFFSELLTNLQDRLDELGYTTLLGMTFESKASRSAYSRRCWSIMFAALLWLPLRGQTLLYLPG